MTPLARAPGVAYEALAQAVEPSPLRSDVAGFFGPTRRGPVGSLLRLDGWRDYLRWFGGLARGSYTPYAIKGYFENGGQVAHVLRVAGPRAATASALWTLDAEVAANGFKALRYEFFASSPGGWANGGSVALRYRQRGMLGRSEIDVTVSIDGEAVEQLFGLDPATFHDSLNRRSTLIRAVALAPSPPPSPQVGPRVRDFAPLLLAGGDDGLDLANSPDQALDRGLHRDAWFDAARALGDEPEVALVVVPDLRNDPLLFEADRDALVTTLLARAAELKDRLCLFDTPGPALPVAELVTFAASLRELAGDPDDAALARSGALYHPWLSVPDPLALREPRLLSLPPSGHVAGVISRLDRERGAHHTPANAPLLEAWDLSDRLDADQPLLNPAGVNLVRCVPGRGLMLWGGRTLHVDAEALRGLRPSSVIDARMLAHERLLQRLVRAIRRVAEPLVFDVNGPELWLALVRAITSVLLEAFRAGALQGDRPEDGFRVRCDAQTNPPAQIELGRCLCEVELAPARPMEFILLKVTLLANGALEVVE